MKSYVINRWKDSASMSWSHNEKSVIENCYFTFEITIEQKDYLESHINEIDEWCEDEKHIGKKPVVIKFEPFWNGTEDVFTCDCYFINSK